ncbi:MAG: ABC transporter permease [Eubacteriales bacterium]|nr:ABC transporter permease [Eubacteriales bacterium]
MTVFKGYMKIIKYNRWLIFMYLAIFFGVTIMFQAATGNEEQNAYQAHSVSIALVGEEDGSFLGAFEEYLGKFHEVKRMEEDTAFLQEELFYRNIEYIVRIPDNFYETCIKNREKLSVTKIPGSYTAFYVDEQINSFLNNARVYDAAGFSEEETAQALGEMETGQVEMRNAGKNAGEVPSYAFYYRYLPYLYMAVLCYVLGNVLSAFRRGDLPRRMKACAVSARRQSMEGFLAAAVMGAGLWIFSISVSFLFYRGSLAENGSLGYRLINSLLLLAVSLALAYFVGFITKDSSALNGIVNVLSLGMSFLCGVFVPLEYMSAGVKRTAQFLPVYWYETVNDILTEYGTITEQVKIRIYQAFGIQLAFAVALVCMTLAVAKKKKA